MKNGPYELVVAPIDYPGSKYRGRYCYEHHLVWWRRTGEIIKEPYCLHHKNEDKRDNRFENLEKLTKSEHSVHHYSDGLATTVIPHTVKHGTEGEYSYGCRCAECKKAHNLSIKVWRKKTGKTSSYYAKRRKDRIIPR